MYSLCIVNAERGFSNELNDFKSSLFQCSSGQNFTQFSETQGQENLTGVIKKESIFLGSLDSLGTTGLLDDHWFPYQSYFFN